MNDPNSPLHVGMRNLKTALAVLICLVIYEITSIYGGFLACVSAVICMQDSVEKSVSSGVSRMYGTGIGALLGVALLYLDLYFNNHYLVFVLITLGIIILIVLCNLLNIQDSIVIGCVVFLTIAIQQTDDSPLMYSIYRLLDTFIGIVVAIIVNRFIKNPATRKKRKLAAKEPSLKAEESILRAADNKECANKECPDSEDAEAFSGHDEDQNKDVTQPD